LQLKLEQTVK